MRVFEGGVGCVRGGIEERSRERGVWVPFDAGLATGDAGGELVGAGILGLAWGWGVEESKSLGGMKRNFSGLEGRCDCGYPSFIST